MVIRALQPNIVRGSRNVKKPDRQAREKFLASSDGSGALSAWPARAGPKLHLNWSSCGFSESFRAQLTFGLDPVAHLIARQTEFATAFGNVVGA
jgi:hypothetical protein